MNFRVVVFLLCCHTLVLFSNGNELNCRFEYFQSHYSCLVQDFVATNGFIVIQKVSGQHLDGNTNDDVERLYFEDQNIPFLPHGIDERFINLKLLSVINSSLVHINNEALKMNNLIDLTIEYNNIKYIDENTFQNLRQLKSLNLASNHIAELHLNTFKNMNELKTLNLNWNQLELLKAGVFNDCRNLQTLMLRQNKLKIIDKSILDPLESLQYIYLQGNVCVNRNDYHDFIELKAEIASKCIDVCAENIQKITDEYNLKIMELQKEIQKLSAEVSNNHKEQHIISQPLAVSEDISIAISPDLTIDIKEVDDGDFTKKEEQNPDDNTDTYLSFKFTTE